MSRTLDIALAPRWPRAGVETINATPEPNCGRRAKARTDEEERGDDPGRRDDHRGREDRDRYQGGHDGYGRMAKSDELRGARQREGLAPDPIAVVVSARLDLPADLPLLNEPEQRVVIATASDATIEGLGSQVEYLRV